MLLKSGKGSTNQGAHISNQTHLFAIIFIHYCITTYIRIPNRNLIQLRQNHRDLVRGFPLKQTATFRLCP